MDANAFEAQIKSGNQLRPVLIFSGPEEFLKERALQKILQKFVDPEDRVENFSRIDCSGRDAAVSADQVFSFSFNPSPRFFFYNNFHNLNAGARKVFFNQLAQAGIPSNTFLIFSTGDAKVTAEIAAAFKQQSEKIDFWRPFENQIPQWVKKEAGELGGRLNNDAAELLIELAGSNLAILFQELGKLITAANGKPVSTEQVKKSVRYLNQDSVFDFLNNFGCRRTKEALRALEVLINGGEAPQKIWFMLCGQLREFRLLHELVIDRPDLFSEIAEFLRQYGRIADKTDFKSNQEKKNLVSRIQQSADSFPPVLAEAVSLKNPNKIKNLHMAMNFHYSELVKSWPLLVSTDLLLKSGVPDPRATLQTFTVRFLSSAIT